MWVQWIQSAVCKSADNISPQSVSPHCRLSGCFYTYAGTFEVRTFEVRTFEVQSFEAQTFEVRTFEVRTYEVRTLEA